MSETLSIVIPVYNEENSITDCLEKVLAADTGSLKKEIIIVDDGSTDNTLKNIHSFVKKNKNGPPIQVIEQKENQGKGSALKVGFMKTTGEYVVVQDADLEYNPNDLKYLLEPFLQSNADVVYGSRFNTNRPHRVLYYWHYVANLFLTMLSNMFTNLNLTDMETGYKAFRGDIIRSIAPDLRTKQFGFEPEVTARIAKMRGIKIYEVGVSYYGRTYAEGKKIGVIDGVRAIWEIVWFNVFAK